MLRLHTNLVLVMVDGHMHLGAQPSIHVYTLGLSGIKNTALQLLQQSHYDFCNDIALEYFTMINRVQHHYICVPLETAIASLFIGMNLWVSIVAVGTYLISTLYWSILMCDIWKYSAIYCRCGIIEM